MRGVVRGVREVGGWNGGLVVVCQLEVYMVWVGGEGE